MKKHVQISLMSKQSIKFHNFINFKLIISVIPYSENSPYTTQKFNTSSNGTKLFPYRKKNDYKTMSSDEYVSIISDILRMKKNICLCRHFHTLNKATIAK